MRVDRLDALLPLAILGIIFWGAWGAYGFYTGLIFLGGSLLAIWGIDKLDKYQ